ncbi:MAG: hypothetical protein WC802_02985 [Patescibacteria group bacterium]|jgi:hypothetical protein
MKKKSSSIAHRTPLFILGAFVLGLILPMVGAGIWAKSRQPVIVSVPETTPTLQETINAGTSTYRARYQYNLPESQYIIDDSGITDTKTGKFTPIAQTDSFYVDSGVDYSILLEPRAGDTNSLYLVQAEKGNRGPIWRIDIATGTIKILTNGNDATSMVVSPNEDKILIPNGTPSPDCDSQTFIDCPFETYSFTLLDLQTDTTTIIGKLPDGYSYSYASYVPNQMGGYLEPLTSAGWSDGGKMIYAPIYSTKTPLCQQVPTGGEGATCGDATGKTITARKAIKTVTISPDQQTVQF